MSAFGCTPAAYRKNPLPIALSNLKVVFFPEHYMSKGETTMNQTLLTEAHVRVDDYLKDCGEVMGRVEELAWNFDPATKGYEWNEDVCQDYQRHCPEVIGYEVLRPVRKA